MADDNSTQMNDQNQLTGSQRPYILMADDSKFYGSVNKLKFENAGFEVTAVSDGAQLIESARQRKPDLILLDLIMPVKDGFETIKELKADPTLKDIKVLVFSDLGQEEEIAKLRALGATDFLVKTETSPQETVEKVKSHLS